MERIYFHFEFLAFSLKGIITQKYKYRQIYTYFTNTHTTAYTTSQQERTNKSDLTIDLV